MGTGFWYGRWFPVLLPAQRCATLARADAIVFVADAQRALWSSCDRGTFHTVWGRPNALAEDDAVSLLDFERVAAAAETALREKLALEVKARPQVPPAALFKPDVKRAPPKKKKKRLGHRHEHRRRLSTSSVREELAIPQDAFVLTTIGTICRRKRQKWALYALRYLVQKRVDAYYLLVGAPSEKGGQGGSCPVSFVLLLRASRCSLL
jgi:glycosyltransferase involved in cell wall biosynthesis